MSGFPAPPVPSRGLSCGAWRTKLEAGQAKVDAREAAAKSDGNVTKKERAELQHARDKQSAKIYKQKHDAQKKP